MATLNSAIDPVGLLRFYLALSVLLFHSGGTDWLPVVPAGVAVYSFFILSGFYITLGLNERYAAAGSNGIFYLSRVLRLWPTYLVSLAFVAYSGVLAQTFRLVLDLPWVMAVIALFSNVTIIGLDILTHISAVDGHIVFSEYGADPKHNGASYILNLPAWSLASELVFYAVAPFVVRSFRRSMVFLAIGIVYILVVREAVKGMSVQPNVIAYFPYYMIFFGLGIAAYWLHRLLPVSLRTPRTWLRLAGYVAVGGAVYWAMRSDPFAPVYVGIALCTPALFHLTKKSRLDEFLGDLAYPIYILHVPVGMVVRSTHIVEPTVTAYVVSALVAAVLALLLVDQPIEKLKYRWLKKRHVRVARGAEAAEHAAAP